MKLMDTQHFDVPCCPNCKKRPVHMISSSCDGHSIILFADLCCICIENEKKKVS